MSILSFPYPSERGDVDDFHEAYLQVIEKIWARWAAFAAALSVHSLACYPTVVCGVDEQRRRCMSDMLGPDQEVLASEATAVDGGDHTNGSNAWITRGRITHFYTLFARLGPCSQSISSFQIQNGISRLSLGGQEGKMALPGLSTTTANYDDACIPTEHRIGAEGQGRPSYRPERLRRWSGRHRHRRRYESHHHEVQAFGGAGYTRDYQVQL